MPFKLELSLQMSEIDDSRIPRIDIWIILIHQVKVEFISTISTRMAQFGIDSNVKSRVQEQVWNSQSFRIFFGFREATNQGLRIVGKGFNESSFILFPQ